MKATLIRLRAWILAKNHLDAFPKRAMDRGIALIFALLLLVLMSALGLIMALTVNPDMMINGYYGNYRGSFYAADSGMNIARQQLLNLTQAQVNMTPCADWEVVPAPCNNPPLLGTTGPTVLDNLKTAYGSFTPLQGGEAANSWPESFEIVDTAKCTNSFAIAPNYPVITHGQNAMYRYGFLYNLCVAGRASGGQQVVTTEDGMLYVNIAAQSNGQNQVTSSFADFGQFVLNWAPCSLGWEVPGLYAGPQFTDGSWNLGWGNYIFTDPVSQVNPNVSYWGEWGCAQSPTTSYSDGHQTVAPDYMQGLNLNQPAPPAPANEFSQEWAVLDGMGCGEGSNQCGNPASPSPPAVQHSDLNAHLMNIHGTPYPLGGAASGVYLPYCTAGPTCTTPNTVNGGGFYVEGNAEVLLTIGNDGFGNPTQTYTITQGGTVTSITTNVAANTTIVASGGNTIALSGVPESLLTTPPSPATMLYVDGTITSLSGAGQGVPAIQDNVAMTITANGDIDCTGDLIYKTEPVTMDTNNTLVPGALNMTQDLGLFTATGSIWYSSSYGNDNVQVDGAQAAIGASCPNIGGWGVPCSIGITGCVNVASTVGAQIQANESYACLNWVNVFFDRRYTAIPNFAPPWFPTTQVNANDIAQTSAPLVTTLSRRMSWVTTPQ